MIRLSYSRTLLLSAIFVTACVRHKTVHDFGLAPQVTKRVPTSPDSTLRAVFQNQTKGAFNPQSDDPRIRSLQSRLTANPADAAARLELATLYEGYRLHQAALEQYIEAFDRSPSEKAVLGVARCYHALALDWRAIPVLEQFLKDTPSAAVWNALGLLQDASGNLAAAESAYRLAIEANPASDQWHNNLGYNLMLQKKTDAAEDAFRKSVALSPNSAMAHNNLATLLARKGDLDNALNEFRFSADEATARNNLAVVLMEFGKYEESREQLIKALALRRNFPAALSNFKLVQERTRQLANAKKPQPDKGVRLASTEQETSPKEQLEEQR